MSSAMSKPTLDADTILKRAAPVTGQHAHEIQPFGHLVRMPIALSEHACKESVDNLNQLLADTMTLRDLYKKHHWQVAGPTFYQLHLLFDKHYDEQNEVVDAVAERIQLLGASAWRWRTMSPRRRLFLGRRRGGRKCQSKSRACCTRTRSC